MSSVILPVTGSPGFRMPRERRRMAVTGAERTEQRSLGNLTGFISIHPLLDYDRKLYRKLLARNVTVSSCLGRDTLLSTVCTPFVSLIIGCYQGCFGRGKRNTQRRAHPVPSGKSEPIDEPPIPTRKAIIRVGAECPSHDRSRSTTEPNVANKPGKEWSRERQSRRAMLAQYNYLPRCTAAAGTGFDSAMEGVAAGLPLARRAFPASDWPEVIDMPGPADYLDSLYGRGSIQAAIIDRGFVDCEPQLTRASR
ncbi:hypothetical protein J6590_008837 [Homalodisca vitripennis]|nr:hypothetical protein J6590_008837 [Homalodisca vitripennis]